MTAAVSWKLIVFCGNGCRPPKWSAAVIASSPSDACRAGQSVSDSRTLGTCRHDLAATAESPAIRLVAPPAVGMDTGAVSREHVVAARVGYGTYP